MTEENKDMKDSHTFSGYLRESYIQSTYTKTMEGTLEPTTVNYQQVSPTPENPTATPSKRETPKYIVSNSSTTANSVVFSQTPEQILKTLTDFEETETQESYIEPSKDPFLRSSPSHDIVQTRESYIDNSKDLFKGFSPSRDMLQTQESYIEKSENPFIGFSPSRDMLQTQESYIDKSENPFMGFSPSRDMLKTQEPYVDTSMDASFSVSPSRDVLQTMSLDTNDGTYATAQGGPHFAKDKSEPQRNTTHAHVTDLVSLAKGRPPTDEHSTGVTSGQNVTHEVTINILPAGDNNNREISYINEKHILACIFTVGVLFVVLGIVGFAVKKVRENHLRQRDETTDPAAMEMLTFSTTV